MARGQRGKKTKARPDFIGIDYFIPRIGRQLPLYPLAILRKLRQESPRIHSPACDLPVRAARRQAKADRWG